MIKGLSFIGLAALLSSSCLEAKPYRVMDVSHDALQALDSSSIKRVGQIASVWMFTQYWQDQPLGKETFSQVKSLAEFDCTSNRLRFQAVHFFADRNTPLPYGEDSLTHWVSIIPDAWVMKARNAACDGVYTKMGTLNWDDYDLMVRVHRQIA